MKKRFLLLALTMALLLGLTNCGDDDKTPEPAPQLYTELKITGIPSGKNIIGASLLDQDQKSVSVGMNNNGGFNLYEPNDDNYLPNPEKPWKGKGNFIVGVAEADPKASIEELLQGQGIIEQYFYTGFDVSAIMAIDISNPTAAMAALGALLAQNPALAVQLANMKTTMMVPFNNDITVTLPWSHFISQSMQEILTTLQSLSDS